MEEVPALRGGFCNLTGARGLFQNVSFERALVMSPSQNPVGVNLRFDGNGFGKSGKKSAFSF
jgi:hypothetical protein